jgi:hypothetical protein
MLSMLPGSAAAGRLRELVVERAGCELAAGARSAADLPVFEVNDEMSALMMARCEDDADAAADDVAAMSDPGPWLLRLEPAGIN